MNLRAIVTGTDLRVRVGSNSPEEGWQVLVDRVYYVGSEPVATKPVFKKSCKDFAEAHVACRAMAEGAALMSVENGSQLDQPFLPAGVVPPTCLVSLN